MNRHTLTLAILALLVTACAPEVPDCNEPAATRCSAGIAQCLPDGWRFDCESQPPNPDGSEVCVVVDADGERVPLSWPYCSAEGPVCPEVFGGSPVCVVYP